MEIMMSGLSKRNKIFKTLCLISVWISIGMNLEITGPTLIDLKLLTQTKYEDVARAASGRGFGFFIGAFIGGFLVEKFYSHCDVMVAVFVNVMGITGITVPHVGTSVMFVVILFQGICEGVVNIAGQRLLLEIWQERSASPMHTLHLGFGIGSLVVPQIAEPFLADPIYNSQMEYNTTTGHNSNSTTVLNHFNTSTNRNESEIHINSEQNFENSTVFKETRVKWAYLIVGLLACIASISFFIFQFCGQSYRNLIQTNDDRKSKSPPIKEIVDPGTCTGGDRVYGVKVFVLLFLFCFQAFGIEYLCNNFLRSYSIDHFHMEGNSASWLNTTFWISYTLGCFLGFVSANLLPVRKLLLTQSVGLLLSTLCLATVTGKDKVFLWIFIQPVGAFIAPAFPICLVWGDWHLKMTGFALTFVLFGGSLGGVAYLWIAGHVYDGIGPSSFPYMCLASGAILFILSLLLHVTTWNKGTRFDHNSSESVDNTESVFDSEYQNIDK